MRALRSATAQFERVVPMAERFWSKIAKDGLIPEHRPELGPCWVWTAACSREGYGVFQEARGTTVRAHRKAWELSHGCIPDDLNVLHHCDNPRCCRPAHLFLGTHVDNSNDKVSKARQARGARHGLAKIDYLTAAAIRAERAGGATQVALAVRHGISR